MNVHSPLRLQSLEERAGRPRLSALFRAGLRDIADGIEQWRLCYLMGSSDMRRRYARSKLGQVWIMISSAIMISTMGFVWSYLWHQPIHEMLPYVAIGMIAWQLIAGLLTEATTIISGNGHYFLNQYMPAATVIFSLLYRQGVTFLLNIIFPVAVAIALGSPITFAALYAIPGLILLFIACFWMAFVLAILCTRFQDLAQIVSSILQVGVFLTPVLWKPETLSPGAEFYVYLNPFAVLLAIVRDPLLDRAVSPGIWLVAAIIAVGGLLLALPFIGRFRRRLIYWL